MNPLKIIILIVFCLSMACTKAQTFEWAKVGNGSIATRIVRDIAENLYVIDNQGVAKYNPIGNFTWQQNITGTDCVITGIAVDTLNNLYVTGYFGGTIDIGTNILVSEAGGNGNTFLVKYNANGIIQWITRSHSNGDSDADGITVDKQGNILIIGRFLDSLRLDSFVFQAPLTSQVFLAKYSSSGVCLWAKHLISDSFDGGSNGPKIKSDKLGNTYISGHFISYALFDTIHIYAHGGQYDEDIFLTKIDASGNFLWAKALGGNLQEISGPMDVDSLGNTYISGYFSSAPTYFGGYTLTTNWAGYFTAKYDTDGNCHWAKHGNANAICAANDGYYTNAPGLITKYDTLGSLQWTKTVSGASNNAMAAVNTDVYLTGSYTGSVNFDTCALSSTSNQMYIAKLSNPDPPIITNLKETENSIIFSVYPNPTGNTVTVSIQSTNHKNSFPLKITNTLSQIVYSETIKEITGSYTKQIDLNSLPKGIYFLELQSNSADAPQKKTEVKKIVLQ